MYIVSEPRVIVGMLKTSLGEYPLLGDPKTSSLRNEFSRFNVVDDEGFDNWIVVRGEFVAIPKAVPETMDVKRVLTEEEKASYNLAEISSV